MTISPRHVWLTTSKMIVRNPADPIYASEGYPAPKLGMVLRNANVTTNTLRDGRLFTSDTAEVAAAMLTYGLYSEAAPVIKALTEATYLRSVWGQQVRLVSEAYFPEGGAYVRQEWESHTRTACLVAYALAKWANHDNTPINGITPRQWAIDIMFSARRTQLVGTERIAGGEQPAWTAGALYENWNTDPATTTATPSWGLLSGFSQDAVELAVAQLLPHGAQVTTTQGVTYNVQTLRDDYRAFLDACHGRAGYLMPCGLPHQRVQLDGTGGGTFANWYTPGTIPPNPIGLNAIWTTDAMAWILRGRALAGKPIAPLVSAFKALLTGTPPTWYDAFNADGSRATDGEVSQKVTQAPAIMYLATKEATDTTPDASLLEYVNSTQLDRPNSVWGHGSWSWTGDPVDHIEAVATALILMAVHEMTNPEPETPTAPPTNDPFASETLQQLNAVRAQTYDNIAITQGHVTLANAAASATAQDRAAIQAIAQQTVSVDTSVGTRVFAGDTTIFGDSGWRTIDTKDNSGGNPNRLDMRRTGGTCYARVYGQPGWANGETLTFTGTPAGFKHELGRFHDHAYGCSAPIVTNIGNGQPTDCGRISYRLWVSEEIQVRITNNGTRYWVAELSWFTSDEWPETLPGTAAA